MELTTISVNPLTLRRAIENNEYETAAQIVHKLKSSSGSIGAKGLYEIASNLQKALNNGDVEVISKLHNEFEEMLEQVLLVLTKRLKP